MIRYVTEKYGSERVAQIVTYGTIKAKQALKDASRVLGYPFSMGERLTKAMPPAVMGKDIPLSGIFDPAHKRYSEATEVRALYEVDPQVKEIVDTARDLTAVALIGTGAMVVTTAAATRTSRAPQTTPKRVLVKAAVSCSSAATS